MVVVHMVKRTAKVLIKLGSLFSVVHLEGVGRTLRVQDVAGVVRVCV